MGVFKNEIIIDREKKEIYEYRVPTKNVALSKVSFVVDYAQDIAPLVEEKFDGKKVYLKIGMIDDTPYIGVYSTHQHGEKETYRDLVKLTARYLKEVLTD